jgi:hypothetical protein
LLSIGPAHLLRDGKISGGMMKIIITEYEIPMAMSGRISAEQRLAK